MSPRLRTLCPTLVLSGAALLFVACSGGDLGAQCALVKANPEGGRGLTVVEGDLPATPSDYVSFASRECREVCVRDANVRFTGDLEAPAWGYCSQRCAQEGSSEGCGEGYTCRALLLSPQTIDALCAANPDQCGPFTQDRSPLFCTRDA